MSKCPERCSTPVRKADLLPVLYEDRSRELDVYRRPARLKELAVFAAAFAIAGGVAAVAFS